MSNTKGPMAANSREQYQLDIQVEVPRRSDFGTDEAMYNEAHAIWLRAMRRVRLFELLEDVAMVVPPNESRVVRAAALIALAVEEVDLSHD